MSKKNINTAPTVAGKKSIKDVHQELGFGELDANYRPSGTSLDIDPALKKELKELGLVYRFINYKTFKQRGFHKAHWKPYMRKSTPDGGAIFTVDPNGYTVHQDLVLAVKPVDWSVAHKKFLKEKADRLDNIQSTKAQELKSSLKSSGATDAKVFEGYDEN